ncbi:MAG: hypothetical protein V5A62_10880 [Haloarculaceae archaeon]
MIDTPDERERRRLLDRFDGLRVADVAREVLVDDEAAIEGSGDR